MAADPAAPMAVPADLFDWSGFYVGAEVGALNWQATNLPGTVSALGPLLEVVGGYNFQSGNLVYGIEADAGYSTANFSGPCANPAWTCKGYVDFQGSLRGRLGWAAENLLMYVTGGLAVARVGGSTVSPGNVEFPDSAVRFGYTLGGGVEAALSDTLSGRVQYQYANYGSRDMNFDVVYPGVAVDSHTVKMGLLAHFN